MSNFLFWKTGNNLFKAITGFFIYIFSVVHPLAAEKWNLSEHYSVGDDFMGITLLGALYMKPSGSTEKLSRELSGLAWDKDEQILYGISDDGYISHIKVVISDGILVDAEIIHSYRLKDNNGNIRKEEDADAEGITIENSDNGIPGDTLLTVILDNNTRIEQYNNIGEFIGAIALPDRFNDQTNVQGQIEVNALAGNSEEGYFFITKKNMPDDYHYIYSNKGFSDRMKFNNPSATNIVGTDFIGPSNLMLLDRQYISFYKPVIYCLRSLDITNMTMDDLACLNTKEGWKLDNFEGVTKHENNNYFLVSDDNESRLQKTLLIYFRCNKCLNSPH